MAPKKISDSAITGDKGLALIHRVVNDMGFIWYPTGSLEVGIDGYIEIRDSATGSATNLIIQVQSKATARDFQGETAEGFDYYCDARDLDYWLGGNAPVILVISRPRRDEAYWISVKDYFKDLSARKTKKIHFDKSRDKFDPSRRKDLIDLARPKDSGVYLPTPPKKETLYSNLLEVSYFGACVYVAETEFRDPKVFWIKLRELGADVGAEWVLKDKRIMTFYNLEEYPWPKLCDQGTVEPFDSKEWAYSDDRDIRRDFARLLNLCLKQKLGPEVRYDKSLEHFFFAPTKDLSPRELAYRSLAQKTSRTVFQGYRKKGDPSRITHYRHSAFTGKFVRFGEAWYLEITPTYHFTWNGWKPHFYREDLLKGIKRLERNAAVLGQVIMWAEYLRGEENLFIQPYRFLRFGSLATFDVEAGLEDHFWLGREEAEEAEAVRSSSETLPLFDGLS